MNTNGTVHKIERLAPRHIADLRASGLSDEQIVRCSFHSLTSPSSVQNVLRWKRYDGVLGECLCIPFVGADGKPTGFSRLKPDNPRKSKEDGKPIKYESPKGSSNRAFFPPGTLASLQDPSAALVITEGEKKAAKADQEGFACIGLVGVYGWQKKRPKGNDGKPIGDRELIDDLGSISWNGRIVYLCFDSDAVTNPSVRRAEFQFAETLARDGAIVKVVRLPQGDPAPDGTPFKVGLDDFLVIYGPDALRNLLSAAVNPAPPRMGLTPNEAADDPHRLARQFIRESCQHADGLTLRFWRDEWHRWDGSAYRIVPEKELRAELTTLAKLEMDRANLIAQRLWDGNGEMPAVRKVTGRMIADVAHALTSLTVLPSRTEAPSWIDSCDSYSVNEVLACNNGLIHLPSLVSGDKYFAKPTPQFFSATSLAFDFNADAPRPVAWLEFLSALWPNDPQSIGTLQEWLGYLLTPDTRHQKMLMLVGPKRSGKGTIARIIQALIGPDNIAGPTLSSLGANFGLWPLLGKPVAIISDARLSGRSDIATITERLLSISGEDAQTVDRKNLRPVTTRLQVRFMLLSNELPKLNDASGALPCRMLLLRMTQSWFGREDTELTDRLLAELPGILIWAIQGWERLRNRGRFIQPDTGRTMIGELEDLASPIGAFVRDRCEIGPGKQVERAVIFSAWQQWCQEQGREHSGDSATFGRNLRAALPTLGDAQPNIDGRRVRVYEGISMK